MFLLSEINLFIDKVHSLHPVCDYLKDISLPPRDKETVIIEDSPLIEGGNADMKGEYWNFCTWALSLGFVLPSGLEQNDSKVHQYHYNNRDYLFSSKKFLNRFRNGKEKALLDIVKEMYDRPELMILMDRAEEFVHFTRMQNQEYKRSFYITRDSICQTEKEPLPRSEVIKALIRDMRKEGLKLANQRNFQDTACQTEGVFRAKCNSGAQTIQKRSAGSQTANEIEIQTDE